MHPLPPLSRCHVNAAPRRVQIGGDGSFTPPGAILTLADWPANGHATKDWVKTMAIVLDPQRARFNMVEQQVRTWEVLDQRVLDVIGQVPREAYAPERYRNLAYADLELPIGHGQCMLKPVVEGRMLQALAIAPDDEVLEIGTGSGYTAAAMGRLGRQVTTLEIQPELAAAAQERLRVQGVRNVAVVGADALSYVPTTRFNAIAVGAAVASIPKSFLDWLAPGGRLFIVRGQSPVQEAVLLTAHAGALVESSLFETDLGYLQGAAPPVRFTL